MDSLNLPSSLLLVWELKKVLENGESLKLGLNRFIALGKKSNLLTQVKDYEKSQFVSFSNLHQLNHFERALLDLVTRGIKGASIYESLELLEHEIVNQCESDILIHSTKWPMIMQIPLMFLILPAIALVLIGPLLLSL